MSQQPPFHVQVISAVTVAGVIIGVTIISTSAFFKFKGISTPPAGAESAEVLGIVRSLAPAPADARVGERNYATIRVREAKQPAQAGDTIIAHIQDPKYDAIQVGDQVRLLCSLVFVESPSGKGGTWEYRWCLVDSEIERAD